MKRQVLAAVVGTAALFALSDVQGADIVNQDDAAYVLYVMTGEEEMEVTLDPGATIENICDRCTIEIEKVGSIEVEGQDVAVVRDGTVSKAAASDE